MKVLLTWAVALGFVAQASSVTLASNQPTRSTPAPRAAPAAPRQTYSAPARSYSAPAPRQTYTAPRQTYTAPARQTTPARQQTAQPARQTTTPARQTASQPARTAPAPARQQTAQPAAPKGNVQAPRGTVQAPKGNIQAPKGNAGTQRPATGNTNAGNRNNNNNQGKTTPNNGQARTNPGNQPAKNNTAIKVSQKDQARLGQRPANLPSRVSVNKNEIVTQHPKDGGFTKRDTVTGKTRVYDSNGKERASFDRHTGTSVFNNRNGTTTVSRTVVGPGGQRFRETTYRGGMVRQSAVINGRYSYQRSYFVGGRTVVINNYNYTRVYNARYGGYYGVYRPTWWGNPYGWHAWGPFIGAYWLGAAFVAWTTPYYWAPNYWNGYYNRYGWGWYSSPFYASYYGPYFAPIGTYPTIGWWLTDYYIARQLEYDRLERQAALEAQASADAATAAAAQQAAQEDAAFDAANVAAESPVSTPIDTDTRTQLADQAQAVVQSVQTSKPLEAADVMDKGHVFTANETIVTTTTVGDDELECKLHPGDMIYNPKNVPLQVNSVDDTDDQGNPVKDPTTGDTLKKTYVTMTVKKSKKGSCLKDLQVVVELGQLQKMLDEEVASMTTGMEEAVNNNIKP